MRLKSFGLALIKTQWAKLWFDQHQKYITMIENYSQID